MSLPLAALRRLMTRRLARSAARRLGGDVLVEQLALLGHLGYWPNLRAPRSFNENVAAVKMFQRDARLVTLSDKVAVRAYVRERVGERYLAEHYAVWTRADDFALGPLPERFVLKPNNACKRIVVVRDKAAHVEADLRATLARWLSTGYGKATNEWWYRRIAPAVFAEELLEPAPGFTSPREIKFTLFHGVIRIMACHHDRFGAFRQTYYDEHWRRFPWSRDTLPGPDFDPPPQLEEMQDVARRLADGHRFVRVDLYALPSGRIAFGEMTFCPGAAYTAFKPDKKHDFEVGKFWADAPPPRAPRP